MESQPIPTIRSVGLGWLYSQLLAIDNEIEGAINAKDIEHIHRMRVASRRGRVIFRIFEEDFPRKARVIWKKQIKNITRALGAARDTDVQLVFLEEMISQAPKKAVQGLRRIHLRLTQKRKELQFDVIKELTNFKDSNILQNVAKNLEGIETDQLTTFSSDLYVKAYESIMMGIGDTLQWDEYIQLPENVRELHALRISIKWLRYTLETFSPIYQIDYRNNIKILKNIQDTLGIIHDCDMWFEHLNTFMVEERQKIWTFYGTDQPFQFLKPGIDYMVENRHIEREHRYDTFLMDWKQLKKENFWQNLRERTLLQ